MKNYFQKLGSAAWDAFRDKSDEENLHRARMTPEEAAEIARLTAENAGWDDLELDPPELTTSDNDQRLIWRVHLSVRGEDVAYKGKHNWIVIDDETGKIFSPEI